MNPDHSLTFIQSLELKIKEIDDPNPDIITHEGYEYSFRYVAKYDRKLPWITFTPYGSDTRIKAEIMRNAGLGISDQRKEDLLKTRQKFNIQTKPKPDNAMLADRFRQKWNTYWFEKAKAIDTLKDPQERFTKPGETVAEPIRLLMDLPDPSPGHNPKKEPESESKSYAQELMEVD